MVLLRRSEIAHTQLEPFVTLPDIALEGRREIDGAGGREFTLARPDAEGDAADACARHQLCLEGEMRTVRADAPRLLNLHVRDEKERLRVAVTERCECGYRRAGGERARWMV